MVGQVGAVILGITLTQREAGLYQRRLRCPVPIHLVAERLIHRAQNDLPVVALAAWDPLAVYGDYMANPGCRPASNKFTAAWTLPVPRQHLPNPGLVM
jgi:hypothetical protein